MEYNYSDYDSSSMYSDESGLEIQNTRSQLRWRSHSETSSQRTNSYRISMANLEETHEAELDAILGELSFLEMRNSANNVNSNVTNNSSRTEYVTAIEVINNEHLDRTHSRSNSIISEATNVSISSSSESGNGSGSDSGGTSRESRTDSPDNDSAFSDTVSLLSSASSSASSGTGNTIQANKLLSQNMNLRGDDDAKTAKIQLALQKLEQASIRRLFVKAFTSDGASKSLLVDERMTCGQVTRLLADKNHVQMEPYWSLVEHLPDLQMERLFEDHELLVENLMSWNVHSKNRVLFVQRDDKISLFNNPEKFLKSSTLTANSTEHDENSRLMLLDEHFNSGNKITLEGVLYMKIESKKAWKRHYFVLRPSGLYYYPKEKTKSPRDLLCHGLFADHNVYRGIGWKKKHRAPTEYTFALKVHNEPCGTKTGIKIRGIKMLCADDSKTMEKWIMAIRVAKFGKQLLDDHRSLLEELTRDELDKFSPNRSNSIGSITSSVSSQGSSTCSQTSNNNINMSNSNGRLSRTSSSSSSGCLSDENNAFDSDFTTGTIKRKPSMKPNLPLTSMTRQLKEVGENTCGTDTSSVLSQQSGILTKQHNRHRSDENSCVSNGGTLKRRTAHNNGSFETMNSTPISSFSDTTISVLPSMLMNGTNNNNDDKMPLSPLEAMPSCMTDSMFSLPPPPEDLDSIIGSTFSLDSLPPPPTPSELMNDLSTSQTSLNSLPPPPIFDVQHMEPRSNFISRNPSTKDFGQPNILTLTENSIMHLHNNNNNSNNNTNNNNKGAKDCSQIDKVYAISPQINYNKLTKSSIKAPPYKSPPPYNNSMSITTTQTQSPSVKTVTFADSPVLLRRKVCFEDEAAQHVNQFQLQQQSPRRSKESISAPVPPPRAEATRLSTISSPKRLSESTSNPPRDFLKDLQRVMRKKWQVAQKCKLEPTTTPQEVLGFRDFSISSNDSTHFYREPSNVSNWVKEHYGGTNVDNLYENLGADMGVEPPVTMTTKKRPPPPPPKRNITTQLTSTTQRI